MIYPEGVLDFDVECEECEEGRVFDDADNRKGWVICECVERMKRAVAEVGDNERDQNKER